MRLTQMRKGIFLVGILLVPSVIYMLFSLGKHNTQRLGFEGAYEVSLEGDTIYQSVPFPALLDENGNPVNHSTVEGKVLLINLFRSPCDAQCADNLTTLNNYLHKAGLDKEWMLLNICLDSISAGELKKLSEKKLYNGSNWYYLKAATQEGLNEFLAACFVRTQKVEQLSALPTTDIALLDHQQRIRAFFNLKFQQDNKKMQDALKLLIQEPHISWKDK